MPGHKKLPGGVRALTGRKDFDVSPLAQPTRVRNRISKLGRADDIYTSARNSASIIPLSRPRIEPERDGWGWLVLLPSGHGWLCGDRGQALREFAGLVDVERRGST